VGTRTEANPDEKLQLISDALAGKDIELQPKFYVPYDQAQARVIKNAKPLAELRKKNPPQALALLDAQLAELKRDEASLRWLPVIARGDWVVLLDAQTAQAVAYLPLNGF
jgi:hypothetical protein